MNMPEALRLALEGLEKWQWDKDPRGADAYITALRAALAGPQSTHSPECYRWHHECAVAEVERLRAALAQQAESLTRAIERAHGIVGQSEDENPSFG